MNAKWTLPVRILVFLSLAASAAFWAACGGGSSSSSGSNNPPPPPVSNTQALEVNSGPANNYTNGLFTSVTICVPGTTNCTTIPNVEVDTGSEGLRILASALPASGFTLPAVTDSGSNPLQECVSFLDGSYVWGPVDGADIELAGEKGSGVPIQIIQGLSPTIPVPNSCTSGGGPNDGTLQNLGGNGILGIGNFRQDCGGACATASPPALYYLCPGSVCSVATVPVLSQLQNPVWTFTRDNNGVMITMNAIPGSPDLGAVSASGTLTFGVGSQSDNPLGSAKIYAADINPISGTNTSFTSFLDTGSNALYFLDHTTLGIPDCLDYTSYYCPATTQTYTVTNQGANGTSGTVTFNVANTDALFIANAGNNWAFDNLGGDSGTDVSSDYFDFGMPFFFGKTVFIGIEGQTAPGGTAYANGYFAY
jgi:hypothetical protein